MPVKGPRRSGRSRKAAAVGAIPLVISAHGLEARWRRGDIVVDHRAPDEPDPNRSVSRARVVAVYDRMAARGQITFGQREAAERYAILREVETGAKWTNGEVIRTANHWEKGGIAQRQLQATEQLRGIRAALGARLQAVIDLLVIENKSAAEIGERFEVHHQAGAAWIVAALERLREHLDISDA